MTISLDKTLRLTIECPEGWTYIGWQRCIIKDQNGLVYSRSIAEAWNNELGADPDLCKMLLPSDGCLFVLLGEFCDIADFVETLSEVLDYPLEIKPCS